MQIKSFTFNPFAENMYVLYDETRECVIMDPGCYQPHEEAELDEFISDNKLIVKNIILTHAHIDHVMGCHYTTKKYGVGITMHKDDLFLLQLLQQTGLMYGIPVKECPEPEAYLEEGDIFSFGNTQLEIIHTPGHSPGSITFIHNPSKSMFCGDVLFQGSIGRTDLSGGNMNTLLNTIHNKLLPLGDDFQVFNGHGPVTTIGVERKFNQYL